MSAFFDTVVVTLEQGDDLIPVRGALRPDTPLLMLQDGLVPRLRTAIDADEAGVVAKRGGVSRPEVILPVAEMERLATNDRVPSASVFLVDGVPSRGKEVEEAVETALLVKRNLENCRQNLSMLRSMGMNI